MAKPLLPIPLQHIRPAGVLAMMCIVAAKESEVMMVDKDGWMRSRQWFEVLCIVYGMSASAFPINLLPRSPLLPSTFGPRRWHAAWTSSTLLLFVRRPIREDAPLHAPDCS